jgi:hypothetical protein
MPNALGSCAPRCRGWAPPVLVAGSAAAAVYARAGRGVEPAERVQPMDPNLPKLVARPGRPAVGFR